MGVLRRSRLRGREMAVALGRLVVQLRSLVDELGNRITDESGNLIDWED